MTATTDFADRVRQLEAALASAERQRDQWRNLANEEIARKTEYVRQLNEAEAERDELARQLSEADAVSKWAASCLSMPRSWWDNDDWRRELMERVNRFDKGRHK